MTKHWLFSDEQTIQKDFAQAGGMLVAKYSFPAEDQQVSESIAVQIASGQTLGFLSQDVRFKTFLARVLEIKWEAGFGTAKIAFPGHLFGGDLAAMITVLFGKISFLPKIKLEDVNGDKKFMGKIHGPKIGHEGIFEFLKIGKKPALMAILKPGIGPLEELAKNFSELMTAGVDIVKDDEICIDENLDASMRRLDKLQKFTSPRKIYVQHLTAKPRDFLANAMTLQSLGAQSFLICPYTYGISVLQELCESAELKVPIFVHPSLGGVLNHGIKNSLLFGKLMRWAGADGVLFPSPYGSISLAKQEALQIHHELTGVSELRKTASVPSAGITASDVKKIAEDFGSEVIINAGTGMAKGYENLSQGVQKFRDEISKYF